MRPSKLQDALEKVWALDAALAAANQRAATVAAAGREMEHRMQQAEAEGSSSWQGASSSGAADAGKEGGSPLEMAMCRERTRLRHEEQLRQALQADNGAAPTMDPPANSGSSSGGSGSGSSSSGRGICISAMSGGTGGQGTVGELTPAQEALLEGLLAAPDDADSASGANPYESAACELAALDAQLAALGSQGAAFGGLEGGDGGAAGAGAASLPATCVQPSPTPGDGQDEDLAAAKDDYLRRVQLILRVCQLLGVLLCGATGGAPLLQGANAAVVLRCRAQRGARATAQRLRSIDAALRALRTGSEPVAAC